MPLRRLKEVCEELCSVLERDLLSQFRSANAISHSGKPLACRASAGMSMMKRVGILDSIVQHLDRLLHYLSNAFFTSALTFA